MDLKDQLTNEKVSKKFKSQFELVNYAIELAANMIHTGRESRVKIDSQNRAMHVLTEIIQDKDRFDEIVPQGVVNETPSVVNFAEFDEDEEETTEKGKSSGKAAAKGSAKTSKSASKSSSKASSKSPTEKKKPRKIIAV